MNKFKLRKSVESGFVRVLVARHLIGHMRFGKGKMVSIDGKGLDLQIGYIVLRRMDILLVEGQSSSNDSR